MADKVRWCERMRDVTYLYHIMIGDISDEMAYRYTEILSPILETYPNRVVNTIWGVLANQTERNNPEYVPAVIDEAYLHKIYDYWAQKYFCCDSWEKLIKDENIRQAMENREAAIESRKKYKNSKKS